MGEGLLSPGHLIIVLVIALIVFGPKRLPELGRSLGGGIRHFKDAIAGEDEDRRTREQLSESRLSGDDEQPDGRAVPAGAPAATETPEQPG